MLVFGYWLLVIGFRFPFSVFRFRLWAALKGYHNWRGDEQYQMTTRNFNWACARHLLCYGPMDQTKHILSIIVVAFNEARHVARLQRSVEGMRKPDGVQVETVLVDGGSRDGTAKAAQAAGFTKVVVLPGANIPVCRNRGAQEAEGDWLAYVDGDCELTEDWLEQAYPLLAASDKTILGWPARPPDPMNWLQAAWNFHWLNKNPHMEEFMGRPVVRKEGFRMATTRNMILHRAAFDAVEGFNEQLSTGEDTDFAFRAYMQHIPVLGVPDLRVIHHGEPATLREFYKQQVWHANRRSYEHIAKISGGKIGGNAPKFAMAFLSTLFFAGLGMFIWMLTGQTLSLILLLPVFGVIGLPAFYISVKGKTAKYFAPLCVLYATYGWARMWDLLGLARAKPSWKTPGKRATPKT